MTDFEDIRARWAAITPGEWTSDGPDGINTKTDARWFEAIVDYVYNAADAGFIAHAPADIKRLLEQHDADVALIEEMGALRNKYAASASEATERALIAEQRIAELEAERAAIEAALGNAYQADFVELFARVGAMRETLDSYAKCLEIAALHGWHLELTTEGVGSYSAALWDTFPPISWAGALSPEYRAFGPTPGEALSRLAHMALKEADHE